jgi:hypothetical protein
VIVRRSRGKSVTEGITWRAKTPVMGTSGRPFDELLNGIFLNAMMASIITDRTTWDVNGLPDCTGHHRCIIAHNILDFVRMLTHSNFFRVLAYNAFLRRHVEKPVTVCTYLAARVPDHCRNRSPDKFFLTAKTKNIRGGLADHVYLHREQRVVVAQQAGKMVGPTFVL